MLIAILLLTILQLTSATLSKFEEDVSYRSLSDGYVEIVYTFVRENVEDVTYALRIASGQRSTSLPSGGSLVASFDVKTDQEAERMWRSLKNDLGGLYCASLARIEDTHTVREMETGRRFRFGDVLPGTRSMRRFYGVLPQEALCTENLTPWLNMLPCRGLSGIASTIDPLKVFSNPYYALTVSVDAKRNRVTQRLVTVSRSNTVRDHMNLSPCELASRSTIRELDSGHVWDLISGTDSVESRDDDDDRVDLSFVRHAVRVGTYGKGLETILTNNDSSRTRSVTFSEFIPWFLKLKYHTLRVVVGSRDVTETLWKNHGADLFVRDVRV